MQRAQKNWARELRSPKPSQVLMGKLELARQRGREECWKNWVRAKAFAQTSPLLKRPSTSPLTTLSFKSPPQRQLKKDILWPSFTMLVWLIMSTMYSQTELIASIQLVLGKDLLSGKWVVFLKVGEEFVPPVSLDLYGKSLWQAGKIIPVLFHFQKRLCGTGCLRAELNLKSWAWDHRCPDQVHLILFVSFAPPPPLSLLPTHNSSSPHKS